MGGVPLWSILLAFVIGLITFLPFPSWNSLVGLVTGATAIMYAFAPVSVAALHDRDPDRPRPYRAPYPKVLNPVAFCAANLIIYWGGFEAMWKLLFAIFIGRVIFEVALRRAKDVRRPDIDWRAASWIWPWLIGITLIGLIGRYGGHNALPDWIDLLVVIAFSLVIFYYAVSLAMDSEHVKAASARKNRAPRTRTTSTCPADKHARLPIPGSQCGQIFVGCSKVRRQAAHSLKSAGWPSTPTTPNTDLVMCSSRTHNPCAARVHGKFTARDDSSPWTGTFGNGAQICGYGQQPGKPRRFRPTRATAQAPEACRTSSSSYFG